LVSSKILDLIFEFTYDKPAKYNNNKRSAGCIFYELFTLKKYVNISNDGIITYSDLNEKIDDFEEIRQLIRKYDLLALTFAKFFIKFKITFLIQKNA